jgi:hypothetical protein
MKTRALPLLVLAALIAVTATSAQAQSSTCTTLVANIPFQFNVAERTLPAGRYIVGCTDVSSDQRVVRLRSESGKNSLLLQTMAVTGQAQISERMVFRRYGGIYFLARVGMSMDGFGLQFRKSRAERNIERQLAPSRPTERSVALRRR